MVFFITYSVHSFRVYSAWEKKRIDYENLNIKVDFIKKKLSDKTWYERVENKIKSNKQGGVLEEELKHLEKGTEEIINSEIVVPPTTESRNLKI